MSMHDEARLGRAQSALSSSHTHEGMSKEELEVEIERVAWALGGIQSTDDPGQDYSDAESDLIDRYRKLEKLIAQKDDHLLRRLRHLGTEE